MAMKRSSFSRHWSFDFRFENDSYAERFDELNRSWQYETSQTGSAGREVSSSLRGNHRCQKCGAPVGEDIAECFECRRQGPY